MRVIWISRHDPTRRQLAELTRLFGPETEVIHHSQNFVNAAQVAKRYREAGGEEMVLVAPLSVIRELCKLGYRPLWADMQPVSSDHPEMEVAINGRFYRFAGFKRVHGVQVSFGPV